MRLPAYPRYKPSGVEWLGDIPESWHVKKLQYLFRFTSGGTPSTDTPAYWDGNLPWVSPKDMKVFRLSETEDHVTELALKETATTLVPPETLLLVARSGILRHSLPVAVTTRKMAINQDIKGVIPFKKIVSVNYFAWLVEGHQSQLLTIWRKEGTTVESLELDLIKTCPVPVPPHPEQVAIAAYLDVETELIERLIKKKRELIERLKENRTALISRTVTRGLPPAAAQTAGFSENFTLKPSGLDWLGDIPAHWKATRLKHIVVTPITDGPHATPEFVPEGIPFISAEAVWGGRLHLEAIRGFISSEDHAEYSRKYAPQKNDIYVVKSGSTTGKVAINDLLEDFNIWSPLAAVRCDERIALPGFIFFALSSDYFQGLVRVSWSFGTQPNIGMEVLENLVVVLPPLPEQAAIAAYLDKETAQLDALVTMVEAAIERLREYRRALITAAVTGKIDVRGAVT